MNCEANKTSRYAKNSASNFRACRFFICIAVCLSAAILFAACSPLQAPPGGEGEAAHSLTLGEVRDLMKSRIPDCSDESQPDYSFVGAVGGFALRIGEDSATVYEYVSVAALKAAMAQHPDTAGLWLENGRFLLDASIEAARDAFMASSL
ncbi:MAG: hypothetical protein LBC69_04385 [Eubacteriaceae bacterium]|nr:hypothetical protein [Eubacteriaceae bacterium]